jgi:CDP-glucose 4,6-dehydratase
MINLNNTFKNKKVIVTGHTGFKGTWLTFWLNELGAEVLGISNEQASNPSNFEILKIKKKIKHVTLDIKEIKKLKKIIISYKPDYIFHLAAQALVKESYRSPLNTFHSNSIGTLNLLDSLKYLKKKCTVILITSDKSYKNLEIKRGYKENDVLGGVDPYSASKACAEIIIQSYVNSFFKNNKKILIGIARAGNVIGGGDWSIDRLVPDCVKSWSNNKKVLLRNPLSTRPWQHVLEAVGGYLIFASKLKSNSKLHGEAINFGPKTKASHSVLNLVKEMKNNWEKVSWKIEKKNNLRLYESNLLKLNCTKAKKLLNWSSILSFKETSKLTSLWYKNYYVNKEDIVKFSTKQLQYFQKTMSERL